MMEAGWDWVIHMGCCITDEWLIGITPPPSILSIGMVDSDGTTSLILLMILMMLLIRLMLNRHPTYSEFTFDTFLTWVTSDSETLLI